MKILFLNLLILLMLLSCSYDNNTKISYDGSELIVNNKVSKKKIVLNFKLKNNLSIVAQPEDILLIKDKKSYLLLNKKNNYLYKLNSSFNKLDSLSLKSIFKIDNNIQAIYLNQDSITILSKTTNTCYSFMFNKPLQFSKRISNNNIDKLLQNNKQTIAKIETSLFFEEPNIRAESELFLNKNKIIYHSKKTFATKDSIHFNNNNIINFCLNDSLLIYAENAYPFIIREVDLAGREVINFNLSTTNIDLEKNITKKIFNKKINFEMTKEIYSLKENYILLKFQSNLKKENPTTGTQIDNDFFAYYLFKNGKFIDKIFLEGVVGSILYFNDNTLISTDYKNGKNSLRFYEF